MRGIETTAPQRRMVLAAVCKELNTDASEVMKVAERLKEKTGTPRYTDVNDEKGCNEIARENGAEREQRANRGSGRFATPTGDPPFFP
ncbi:hypothetical protein V3C99_008480 [Haemonchus contortus]